MVSSTTPKNTVGDYSSFFNFGLTPTEKANNSISFGDYTGSFSDIPEMSKSGLGFANESSSLASINLPKNVLLGEKGEFNYGAPNVKAPNSNFFASPEFANSLKAFEVISGLGQTYLGYRGLGLAKKQFNLDKKIQLANLDNNIKAYNTTLGFNLRDAGLSSQYDNLKLNT